MKNQSRKYYYNLQIAELEKIRESGKRPSLLMHTCCCVCACYPIVYLSEYFDLTLYYFNDNIYPEEEYEKRYGELERYVNAVNEKYGRDVKLIKCEYHGPEYTAKLEPLKDEPEGGRRCRLCFSLRLDPAMAYGQENGYDYFTTVMTISRQKDSVVLNQLGEQLQKKYPDIRYFFSDLKKDGGLEKGNALVREYDIYRQNYCGCLYSYQEMLQRARSTFEAQ